MSWKQQGLSIVGNTNDYFGSSLAFSADTMTLAVGAPFAHNNVGYVKVYHTESDGGNRAQVGQTIAGDVENDKCGLSLDISSDGHTLAIGFPGSYDDADKTGYVRVFSLYSDEGTISWKQIGHDIKGEAIGDMFGSSVSLSEDGKVIAVGAQSNDGETGDDSGHVRIFHLEDNGESWKQIGQDIDGEAADDCSGSSVSLSADGKVVAIGSPCNNWNGSYSGQVRLYRIDIEGSSWELVQRMYGDSVNDGFGSSVSVSANGITLAVGAKVFFENDEPGYVRVFATEGTDDPYSRTWMQIGRDIPGKAYGDEFGSSVSLSSNGETLAVGARFKYGDGDSSGHVQVYRMDNTTAGFTWKQLGDDIKGGAADDQSGQVVTLSADGNTVAIGFKENNAKGEFSYSGQVTVFRIK